jgi:hypothetical protein
MAVALRFQVQDWAVIAAALPRVVLALGLA